MLCAACPSVRVRLSVRLLHASCSVQVIVGILLFPTLLLLEYRSREELELMPQTKDEHIQDLERSDSGSDSSQSSSDSDSDGGSLASSRHSVKSQQRHSAATTHVPTGPLDHTTKVTLTCGQAHRAIYRTTIYGPHGYI